MFPGTAAEFTGEGTASILVYKFILLWGCPRTILWDNDPLFCSKLPQAVYQLLGAPELATSSCLPNGDRGVEGVKHTMPQMLAVVVSERQDDWDLQLSHVEFAYTNSVSAATGLVLNGVHIGRRPRPPLMVFESNVVAGHRSLTRDHLTYYDLPTDRQQRTSDIVCKHHALIVSRVSA